MKTDTRQKILAFVKEKGQARPKEVIQYIGFGAPAIFRQLKKLVQQGQIMKKGVPPRVFYFPVSGKKEAFMADCLNWAQTGQDKFLSQEIFCPTRDVFQARLEHSLPGFRRMLKNQDLAYLLVALMGEIGNNSFDHNLGSWLDRPGVYFKIDREIRMIALADRGQGVFATIKKVRPNVSGDGEALRIAFTEIVSGRAPEQRGNGLKFVKKIIQERKLKLKFYSGRSFCYITFNEMAIESSPRNIPGAAAIIEF